MISFTSGIFFLEGPPTNGIWTKRDRNVTHSKSGFKFVFYRLGLAHYPTDPTLLATIFLLIEIYSLA